LIELEDLQAGNNDFVFLINDTPYCDPSLPNVNIDGKVINSISIGTDPRNTYISMSSNVKMNLTWKVQIVGNWSETVKNVIDCQFDENGNLCASLPELPAGNYEYMFLINGSQFVDESLAHKKNLFKNYNFMEIQENEVFY